MSSKPVITVSQNEVAAAVVKAARGIGADWGLAHDAGYLAQMLGSGGNPFLGGLLRVLDACDGTEGRLKAAGLAAASSDGAAGKPLYAPLWGLMLAEWVAAAQTPWEGDVVAPRYLLAALVHITGAYPHLCFAIDGVDDGGGDGVDDGVDDGGGGLKATIAQGAVMGSGPLNDQRISLHCLAPLDTPAAGPPAAGGAGTPLIAPPVPGRAVDVPLACWQRLEAYGARTYVAESERSRAAGAGAGDIDND